MIVRRRGESFVCIAQHDHAQLSGWFAAVWGNDRVPSLPEPRSALRLAAAMHDVGWIPLDQNPSWNDELDQPYSFTDFPAWERVKYYGRGVDLVQRLDDYAALLCSLHYTTFFPPPSEVEHYRVRQFLLDEARRQQELCQRLQRHGRHAELERRHHDLALIKLWDSMSLYVALNEPGVSKDQEHPWYKDGFSPVTFPDHARRPGQLGRLQMQVAWLDRDRVMLDPYPFDEPVSYMLPVRILSRQDIQRQGLAVAYRTAPIEMQLIRFVGRDGNY